MKTFCKLFHRMYAATAALYILLPINTMNTGIFRISIRRILDYQPQLILAFVTCYLASAQAEDAAHFRVRHMPGQESRCSDNLKVNAEEVEWHVGLPSEFRGRFSFAINRD